MDTNTATQLSHEFESALSEILPDLYQLLQQYQVSSSLEIVLNNPISPLLCCIRCNGRSYCGNPPVPPPECQSVPSCLELTDKIDPPGAEPEETQQFSKDLASMLSTILPRISEFIQQMDESFDVRFLIDPTTVNDSQMSCRFINGEIVCSDQPQAAVAG